MEETFYVTVKETHDYGAPSTRKIYTCVKCNSLFAAERIASGARNDVCRFRCKITISNDEPKIETKENQVVYYCDFSNSCNGITKHWFRLGMEAFLRTRRPIFYTSQYGNTPSAETEIRWDGDRNSFVMINPIETDDVIYVLEHACKDNHHALYDRKTFIQNKQQLKNK